MGSVERNPNGDCIEEASVELLLSSHSPNVYNIFGEPELHPRVGDEYQVEIPPLISHPFELKSESINRSDFLIGLPIPMFLTNKELEFEKGLAMCRSAKERKAYKKHISKGCRFVPGSVGDSWNKIEERCFLLGLYIFGKDLISVKNFVDTKTMENIQLYYYGKFYKSNDYRRWSQCRKVKTRKCAYGHKLFCGMRQQILLSRLLPCVSEEIQSSLSEASNNYNDGKLSLKEYVFALKAIVGVKNFVQAVAIGEGKRDLTSMTKEPQKPNLIALPRSELPGGKACSSLTPAEITNCLTGGCRLSKARSNDLFWEAVWPRLLARGWHSEEPKDQIYAFGSKGTLVFLIPGVKKFSRRKLVKGNHYFDCVTDVLNKVALDPSLIELDSEGGENNENKIEDGWTKDTTAVDDDVSSQQRHRYLQPRTLNRVKGVMKYTIVDTSMTDGKVFRLRELTTLADDNVLNMSIVSETPSEGSDESESKDTFQHSDIEDTETSLPTRVLFQQKAIETGTEFDMSKDPDFKYKIPKKRVRGDNDLGEVKRPKNSPKCYRGLITGSHEYLSPVAKRSRKLSSCNQSSKVSDKLLKPAVGPTFQQEKRVSCSEATESSENNQIGSFSKDSSFEGSQGLEGGVSNKPQSREVFDLNFPQVSPEFENHEVLTTGSNDEQGDQMNKPEHFTAPKHTTEAVSSSRQLNNNNNNHPLRHSTRNRPPTMKALEALANGFLTVNTRKKKKEVGPAKTSTSRSGHHASGGMKVTEGMGNNGSEDTQMTGVENGESNGDSSVFRNATQGLC